MNPTDMTVIGAGNPEANCLMACVASIFAVEIATLPVVRDYEQRKLWWGQAIIDAVRPFGRVPLFYDQGGPAIPRIAPHGYQIAYGKSPRSDELHAVVTRDGEIVFDPHPTRGGLDGPITGWIVFVRAEGPAVIATDTELLDHEYELAFVSGISVPLTGRALLANMYEHETRRTLSVRSSHSNSQGDK